MKQPPAVPAEGRYRIAGAGTSRRLLLPRLTEVPGLSHGFTTRGSLEADAVVDATGRPIPLSRVRQRHGRDVHAVDDHEVPLGADERPPGDALITHRKGVGLAVSVADCVPVLVCDPTSGWIGAVHAGWRGTAAGVLTAAISALARRGVRSADLLVGLGPCIGPCCFEVGMEVVDAFREAGLAPAVAREDGDRAWIDLIEANRLQAQRQGVPPERMQASGLCTACRPDLLESYRRSRGGAGRTTAFIAWND